MHFADPLFFISYQLLIHIYSLSLWPHGHEACHQFTLYYYFFILFIASCIHVAPNRRNIFTSIYQILSIGLQQLSHVVAVGLGRIRSHLAFSWASIIFPFYIFCLDAPYKIIIRIVLSRSFQPYARFFGSILSISHISVPAQSKTQKHNIFGIYC